MRRTFVLPALLIVGVLALASQSARANEITVGGTTSSTAPTGISFTLGNSFSGTTVGGFAGFSNLGSYTLSSGAGTYNNTLTLTVVFTVPVGISGGGTSSFTATLFGIVNTNAQGGVDIVFNPSSQPYTFSNSSGTGSFTFNLNNVSLNPGGTTTLSGFVTGGTFTPASVPEPSSILLLGAGLLLTPFLRLKRTC